MAEEPQYSSDTSTTPTNNKRKYEDQTATGTTPPPATRRPTGFSSGPIPSASPDAPAPPLYNSVPPPPAADDVQGQIQNAKQRAQEIASRLLFNASVGAGAVAGAGAGGFDVKRSRVENGSGFDSDKDGKAALAASAASYTYGQGTSKKIDIPNGRVGVIIGKAGETIKYLQLQSGAKIQVTRDMDADPNSPTRSVELVGTPEQIAKAEQLISEVLAEAESGGSGIVSRRITGQTGSDQVVLKIPNNKVGLVIGKGGETIKNMQARTGARIQVVPLHPPLGDTSAERNLYIDGSLEQIEAAKQLVNEVISENRLRTPAMAGGYPQQSYQARPPASWGVSGAPSMQQAGYGYMQPGGYPPQYNMSQPQYGGYPPQPASGGYPSNWDQSTGQQPTQGSAYDYYGQQAPAQQQQTTGATAGSTDGYNYSQPPATTYPQGQGYTQDGYGGYQAQSGYGQPPAYDQQQGYNAGTGYAANPGQDGQTPSYGAQSDSTQAPPASQPSSMGQQTYASGQPGYPPQGASQPGYGVAPTSQAGGYGNPPTTQSGYGPGYGPPQGQKPAGGYGQAQQSPSTPGGYGQAPAGQPGYPHSQPPPSGYSQPDPNQRAPPSGYGTAAAPSGYGAPPYGAPPSSQSGYGQQPPAYGSYGGAYPQPPAYSADGSAGAGAGAGAGARGTYDAVPPPQASQQPGVAKTSPQS